MIEIQTRAISAIRSLTPFPPVAAKVILLCGQSASIRELGEMLQSDAALSAEVLRLANSPLFGVPSQLGSVPQAVSFLGIGRLTGLMVLISLSKIVERAKSRALIRRWWRHNLATALAAQEFASSFGADADEAYNAGLFHGVGSLAFLATEPDTYEALLRRGGDVQQHERECFGADHCEAGAWLLNEWSLPYVFVEAARHHHDPTSRNCDVMLVNASCIVANQMGFSVVSEDADECESPRNDQLNESITAAIALWERELGL